MLQELYKRQARKPFEPFVVRMNDGRKLTVTRASKVHPRPSLNTFLYWNDKLRGPESFDAAAIVEVVKVSRRTRKRRARPAS